MTLLLLKATLVMALALAAARLATRTAAATRHAIAVAGQMAALVVPLLGPVMPSVAWVEPRIARITAAPRAVIAAHAEPAAAPRQTSRADIDPILAVWLLGCAIVAAKRARSLWSTIAVVRRARPWHGVLLSDDAGQPFTFGARIVLPSEAVRWDARRLEAVLLHERAHVARRDSLAGALADVVCAVYWFHPLAWLLARRARLERERACDEAVLGDGIAATDYAAVLLDVARSAGRAHGLPMAARSELATRIDAILRGARTQPHRGARALVAAAALVVAPLVAALTPLAVGRPLSGEPDLLGDAIAPPSSEWIGAPPIDVAAAGDDAALIALMQTLAAKPRDSDIDLVPDRARWALHRARGGRLVLPLLDALGERDWRVRAYAAWALGVARDRRATAPLLPLLRDPVWRMRAMAAFALAEVGDPAARAAMREALSDPAWQVRCEAVRYLAALRDPADRELLAEMRSDRHIVVRTAAEEALR